AHVRIVVVVLYRPVQDAVGERLEDALVLRTAERSPQVLVAREVVDQADPGADAVAAVDLEPVCPRDPFEAPRRRRPRRQVPLGHDEPRPAGAAAPHEWPGAGAPLLEGHVE